METTQTEYCCSLPLISFKDWVRDTWETDDEWVYVTVHETLCYSCGDSSEWWEKKRVVKPTQGRKWWQLWR